MFQKSCLAYIMVVSRETTSSMWLSLAKHMLMSKHRHQISKNTSGSYLTLAFVHTLKTTKLMTDVIRYSKFKCQLKLYFLNFETQSTQLMLLRYVWLYHYDWSYILWTFHCSVARVCSLWTIYIKWQVLSYHPVNWCFHCFSSIYFQRSNTT